MMKIISLILLFPFFLGGNNGEKKVPAVQSFSIEQQQVTHVQVEGNIKGLPDGQLTLSSFYKTEEKSTIEVKDSKFHYNGTISSPGRFVLTNSDYTFKVDFFLEQGKLVLSGELGKAYRIKGGKIQKEYTNYQQKLKVYDQRINALDDAFALAKKENNQEKTIAINKELSDIANKKKERSVAYIKQHPASYISLDILVPLVRQRYPSFTDLKELYGGLKDDLKSTKLGSDIKKGIDAISPTFVTYNVPSFSAPDVDSSIVNIADYKGKYVFIDFWASWCAPCRAENPHVVKAYNKYHEKGLEILGVSLDTKKDAWLKAIDEDKLPWRQVSNLKGWKDELVPLFKINGIPDNFLVDPNGVIIARNLRGKALEEKLSEVFK